jgi:hypothetical protein
MKLFCTCYEPFCERCFPPTDFDISMPNLNAVDYYSPEAQAVLNRLFAPKQGEEKR